MRVSRQILATALAVVCADANAQWERLGAPGTIAFSSLVVHKDKAHAIIDRSLFAADREAADRTVFYNIDQNSSGLTTALSWGELFVTGSTAGRVVVYSDVSTAQRLIDGSPTIQSIRSLAALGNVLLVGSYEGVHRSEDTLQSAILSSAEAGFLGVNRLEVLGSLVHAATDSGLFASSDTGSSWDRIATPRRKILDVARFRDTLFIGTEAGLYRSADNGAHWTDPLWPSERFPRLVVSGGRLFAATQTDLWRLGSDASGWTKLQFGLAGQFLDVVTIGRTEMVASYWGVAVAENGGPWSLGKSGSPPSTSTIQTLTTDGDLLLAGTDGRGTFVSADRGHTWTMRSHPFHYGGVYGVLSNAMHDGIWYSTTSNRIHRSADSGISWDISSAGIPADTRAYYFLAQGSRLWVGTAKGPYYTDNHGDSWTATPGRPAGAVFELAATSDGTLWAATDSGVQKSSSPYQTWSFADSLPRGTTVRLSQRGDTLFATASTAGPWRSLDGGKTWKHLRTGLPGAFLRPAHIGTRHSVAANGVGQIFTIGHSDTSWQSFQENLPDIDIKVTMLLDDTVYAWSGGFYRRALTPGNTSIGKRTRASATSFTHDFGERSLRFHDPRSLVRATVRDISGHVVLDAPAGTSWLSLKRLPAGLYALSLDHSDRRPEASKFLHR